MKNLIYLSTCLITPVIQGYSIETIRLLDRHFQTPSSMASGGLGGLLGSDWIVENPTIGGAREGWRFGWQSQFRLPDEITNVYRSLKDAQNKNLLETVEGYFGTIYDPGVLNRFYLYSPYLAWQASFFQGNKIVFHNFNGNLFDLYSLFQIQTHLSSGWKGLSNQVQIGGSLVMKERLELDIKGSLELVSDLTNKNIKNSTILSQFIRSGQGLFVNTSVMFTPELPWSPLMVLTIEDLIGTYYSTGITGSLLSKSLDAKIEKLNSDPAKIHLGFSVKPEFGLVYLRPSLGFKYFNLPLSFDEKIRLSLEGGVETKLVQAAAFLGYYLRNFQLGFRLRFYECLFEYAFAYDTVSSVTDQIKPSHNFMLSIGL